MQEPMKTSSTLRPATSDRRRASSGSLGAHRMGSVMSSILMWSSLEYTAFLSASNNFGWAMKASILAIRRAIVRLSPYPSAIIHLRSATFEFKYSRMGSGFNLIVHPAADRSAEASDNSKACSQVKSGSPSISNILPENTFFLFFFSTVNIPFLMA